ncbi:SprB repeat-containing protein, partial [Emticicia sp. W12TSBA100-4]|uniref:SprB repeat-containing protein n=1 Tax=Emticicia sp. W12TSBA100-4 TaxID=3160965 RepID=UPI0033057921
VNITSAGTYTVTVTNANGCSATATTSVTVDMGVPIVVINATEDTLTCLKTQSVLTAEITPSGTYTYLWSNGSTVSNINVNDAGTYSVEVAAANGCKVSASVLIREFNTVTAQVNVKAVDCKGGNNGKITVTGFDGIAPYKFKLNTGIFQSNNVFDGLTAGTYAVAIQDAGGCTASINITVNEPLTSVALAVTPTNLKCSGATNGQIQATATGGTPAYTFAINGAATQPNSLFTNLVAGTYMITATDTKGCSTTATTAITQPTKLAITAVGSTIDCSTPKGIITATVTGGTPAYQYSIDGTNFQPSNSFANLNGGTYTITVKDLNLCVGTVTAAITVADTVKPTFTSVTATMATCTAGTANNDGKLTVTGVVNGVNYQYSAGNTFNASTAVPAVAAAIPSNGVLTSSLPNPTANSQFYTIRIFNNNGCYKDVTVELLKRVCECKTEICVPFMINKTKTRSK